MLKITRRPNTAVPSWRADPKVVATQARITELEDFLARAASRLAEHDRVVADAAKEVERAEVAVLAGRGTDKQLAVVQQRHLELRRARAVEIVAVEDAKAELAKLQSDTLPTVVKAARRANHKALRKQAVALLREMQASLAAMAQAEADYSALVSEADQAFPVGINDGRHPEHDPEFHPKAGFHELRETRRNGYRQEIINLEGATERFARDIEELLAALES